MCWWVSHKGGDQYCSEIIPIFIGHRYISIKPIRKFHQRGGVKKNNGQGPIVLNESSIELFLGLVNGMPTPMNIQVTIREGRKERGQV